METVIVVRREGCQEEDEKKEEKQRETSLTIPLGQKKVDQVAFTLATSRNRNVNGGVSASC